MSEQYPQYNVDARSMVSRAEWDAAQAALGQARNALVEAYAVMDFGIKIMTPGQVSHWEGVRRWQEFDYPAACNAIDDVWSPKP